MQVVIDIPKEVYDRCKEYRLHCGEAEVLEGAVARGTSLPKGHGRLIDADTVDDIIYDLTRSMDLNYGQISEALDNVPTIVEADKESEE